VPPRALRDRLDDVVEFQLRPLGVGRHEVEDLAVAYALSEQALGRHERLAVGAAQQPAAVPLAVVGETLAGVAQHLGKQLGERDVLRKGDIDPPLRCTDRYAGESGGGAQPSTLVNRHARPPVAMRVHRGCGNEGTVPTMRAVRRPPPPGKWGGLP
jgi:hypothetical protein